MSKIHFIGIGGAGVSGLALAHLDRGDAVSGSDHTESAITQRLVRKGATVYSTQVGQNILNESPSLVVYTAAVKPSHPEIAAAQDSGIPTLGRAEYLGQLADTYSGPRIAITGTHGKTTTTTMVTEACIAAGLDPTSLIGADYAAFDGNYRHGASGIFITEACEAYSSFLHLHPDVAVITNVESDHLDHYQTESLVFEAFRQFCDNVRPGGAVIYCGNDPGAVSVAESMDRVDVVRLPYGIDNPTFAINAQEVLYSTLETTAQVEMNVNQNDTVSLSLKLKVPGKHNLQNALAALAVVAFCGGDVTKAALGLLEFSGNERRFQLYGDVCGRTLVDDYAHHPTEIRATIEAARQMFPERKLNIAFQPHLFSRTRDFHDEFAEALSAADGIIITDIYPAREDPIPGVHASSLVSRISRLVPQKTVIYVEQVSDVSDALIWISRPGQVIMTMGAGNIDAAARALTGGGL